MVNRVPSTRSQEDVYRDQPPLKESERRQERRDRRQVNMGPPEGNVERRKGPRRRHDLAEIQQEFKDDLLKFMDTHAGSWRGV